MDSLLNLTSSNGGNNFSRNPNTQFSLSICVGELGPLPQFTVLRVSKPRNPISLSLSLPLSLSLSPFCGGELRMTAAMEMELEPRVKALRYKIEATSRESPSQMATHVLDFVLRTHWSTATNIKEWILLELEVVTGKGHETYQIEGDKKEFFDDREECREALHYVDELHQAGIDTSEFPWWLPESH